MASFENPNWLLECPLIDELPVSAGDFYWDSQGFNSSSNASVEIDSSFVDSDGLKESGSRKRTRAITSNEPGSKACREKMRRDRLNDKFLELSSILEPGKKPKMDKAAILSDAARTVIELRSEAQKLKDSNDNLQEKIKELKAEKNELRDEKQKLKAEKENLEQQIKFMNSRPSFLPPPSVIPAAFAAQPKGASSPATSHKLMMPVIGYPGFPMWQFMPPTDVDTSQDAESCPPAA
ncbi:transcription factor ILR3-like isoform X2 [Asparagus officinalis]|uniref:transcription factor ILR3-like isoform X1 n=1 Tax=Asparagus officinalis TaxID=4686 RepID=UPI00098E6506|nr:transcription factor ILR3-like isoform X1 [Asparagus officinalis]XP_020269295.1 transcription factor ILR3-like isoform X2 [Asparagus officinalis]